ncbi:MAG TPA: glycoside hydrolase family 43 protein [Sedimentisphaerales bacterium]|nr:glycoside hydrolase family 43 protein [Sedimentisphaerales bacterium]
MHRKSHAQARALAVLSVTIFIAGFAADVGASAGRIEQPLSQYGSEGGKHDKVAKRSPDAVRAKRCADQNEVYLFSSFRGEREGLYLVWSEDLHNWTEIPGPHLKPTIGDNIMRDPFIMMGPDGTIRMVWTTGWKRRDIGYASTRDLINWSEPRLIPLMESKPKARNCWAPKIFYDGDAGQWQIVWSTWLDDGTFPPAELPHTSKQHRIWYVTTKDFESLSEVKLLLDPGYSCIDAYLLKDGQEYLLFFKDERYNDSEVFTPAHQNIRIARSRSRYGLFGDISEPITGSGPGKWHNEGPCAVKAGDEYYVFYDHHSGETYYGAVKSRDLKNWVDVSEQIHFPKGLKHGSIIKVPKCVLTPLLEKRGHVNG